MGNYKEKFIQSFYLFDFPCGNQLIKYLQIILKVAFSLLHTWYLKREQCCFLFFVVVIAIFHL